MKEDLQKVGHYVSLSFTTGKENMQNLDKIIIGKEVMQRKDANLEGRSSTKSKKRLCSEVEEGMFGES